MLKIIQTAARIVLGLIYFLFGGMGLMIALGITHREFPPMTPGAEAFFKGIMATGFFFPLLKVTETLCGFLILINVMTPLVLIILAPITLNIVLFHTFLTPGAENLYLPLAMLVLHLVAASRFIRSYRPLFSAE